MAVLELENMKRYLNGLHKTLASLKKDEPTDSYTFGKLFINADELVVALNADLEDFADSGLNVDPIDHERLEDTKVGVSVRDDESYKNALKTILLVAKKYDLVRDEEIELDELNPEDYLYHDGDEKVKVLVYTPTTKVITVKVPQINEKIVTRMVPLTFTQKLVMVGATPKDKENHERIRTNFDLLLNKFMQKSVKYRVTKKFVKITYKRETLCKMTIVGKRTIKVYLALNPFEYMDNYKVVDCSNKGGYDSVPTCLKVTGRVSLNRAYELIDEVMKNYEIADNKKYIPNYPYSKEIIKEYKENLKEKANA